MDEFLLELRELDETQERVEAVSHEMLLVKDDEDPSRSKEMVAMWLQELLTSDFQSERIAFLYVANHVLQKALFSSDNTKTSHLIKHFQDNLEQAVAFVSNSPTDRHNVTRLLELWHEKEVFPDDVILKYWKATGEEIPSFLKKVQSLGMAEESTGSGKQKSMIGESDFLPGKAPSLPVKLNAHSANPVLDALKKIDHHQAVIDYMNKKLKAMEEEEESITSTGSNNKNAKSKEEEKKKEPLLKILSEYTNAQDILAADDEKKTTSHHFKKRVEDTLRLVKIRNKHLSEIHLIKEQLILAAQKMIQDEELAGEKIESKLEQCDMIDIGLADLTEHRNTYPLEWRNEAHACVQRRKRREEEMRLREEEMARLHQEAIAESAAHASELEASISSSSSSDLQTISKSVSADKESKPEENNEYVWHPVLKELVPLQSLNRDHEEWRDH